MNGKTRFVMGLLVVVALLVAMVPAIVQAEEGDDYYYDGSGWCHGGTYGAAGLSDRTTVSRVAGVLGVTSSRLNARLRAGDTVADIAAENGVPLQKAVDTALARHKDLLERQVKTGYVTESQADAILRVMQEETTVAFEDGYGYGFGGYGMGPGMMGGWGHMGGMMGPGMMGGYGRGSWGW
ncbi:MAG: hypothetical protein HY675_03280 [Chloroflexi bacterium]|nr:hypothetical protein [Chloroflexota bacterium]